LRFDDLEEIAFEKEAGLFGLGFRAASSLGAPLAKGLEYGAAGLGFAGRAVGAVAKPLMYVPQQIARGANALGLLGAKAAVGAGMGVAGVGAGAATAVGRAAVQGVALPAARFAAGRFAKAPVGTTLGALGAYGSAKSVGNTLSGARYDAAINNPALSTAPDHFGTAKYNPFNKFGEAPMSSVPKFDDLEKVAEMSLTARGTLPNMLTEKLLFPMVAQMAAPVMQMFGHRIAAKMFSPQALAHSEEIHGKAMAEYESKQQIGKLDAQKKEHEVRPKMNEVFENLRKQDKVLAEAYRDPTLKNVMHNTMETVYAFAPDVAKDHRTLQSVLREAITAPEGGLSFQTAKQLAEAQKFISESKGSKR
jgi:hypothetical protein